MTHDTRWSLPGLSAGAEELAVLLSCAVQIEPVLMRAVRLELAPRRDVGAETDLWFSDWAGTRSAESIRLRDDILETLRRRLAERLAADRQDPAWRLWEVYSEVHTAYPAALLLEERLAWSAVRVMAGDAEPAEIEETLRPALRAVVVDHSTGVLEWFAAAWHRLPDLVQNTVAAWQLLQSATADRPESEIPVHANLELSDVAPLSSLVVDTMVPVRHDGLRLHVNAPNPSQGHLLPVPDTWPRVIGVSWETAEGHQQITIRVFPDQAQSVIVGPVSVLMQNGRGMLYALSPERRQRSFAYAEVLKPGSAPPSIETVEQLRHQVSALREGRGRVAEALVGAIEDEIRRYRGIHIEPGEQGPPATLAEVLPFMGLLIHEASWQALTSADSGHATVLVSRLSECARQLPWPEHAPRALGAIRIQALLEARNDTVNGHMVARKLLNEARVRCESYIDALGEATSHSTQHSALAEMHGSLTLAELANDYRLAENAFVRWEEARGSTESQHRVIVEMFADIAAAVGEGERALTTAETVHSHSRTGLTDPLGLTPETTRRNLALTSARLALLLFALTPKMHELGYRPGDDSGVWQSYRTGLLARFEAMYRCVEDPFADGKENPISPVHVSDIARIRLSLGLLAPGYSLPSIPAVADVDPCLALDPLDQTAVEALSVWLTAPVNGRSRGGLGILGEATMPAFLESVEACEALTGVRGGFRAWRQRWSVAMPPPAASLGLSEAPGGMQAAWTAFARVTGPPADAPDYLTNAKGDLEYQRAAAIGDRAAALPLTCTVDAANRRLVVDAGDVRVGLAAEVIAKAAEAEIPPLTLVASAFAASAPLDHSWRPRPVGGTTQPSGTAQEQLLRAHRFTDVDREIERALREGRDVILMGEYGAGKSATAALHARRCVEEGYGAIWLDLTDTADGAESMLAELLAMHRHDRYLVFVDCVQANPPAFEAVQRWVRRLREEFGLTVQILATAWPRLVSTWREPFKEFHKVNARPDELISKLIVEAEIPAGARSEITKLVGHDVHLAVDAVDFYRLNGRAPSWSDLQSALTGEVQDDEGQRALYWLASLSFFGLDASAHAFSGSRSLAAADELVAKGLLAQTDGRYSIPSHARARLALRQALTRWNAAVRWGAPDQLVWEHLQQSGERVIRATLGRLDLVGLSGQEAVGDQIPSTRYLARAWDLFTRLGRTLARRCQQDPTWGDNVGAAIFAAKALTVIDFDETWQRVAAYIRGRWNYHVETELPVPAGEPSAESYDFDRILLAMRQEDEDRQHGPQLLADPADTIDMEGFYQTWMLGALLRFEGTALHPDPLRLDALIAMAEHQMDPAGYFNPRRVPWVTARIVIGLCEAGENYHSSEAVRRACDWLRRPVSEGGPFDFGWQSGTGSWNTPEAATAMCIAALLRAGAPAGAETEAGLLWLRTRVEEWTRPGREIDLALVLEAMLLGNDPQPVYQRVLDLLMWAQNELKRAASDVDDSIPEAGLRLPFVAAQLADFVWATVTSEYKALLRALIAPMETQTVTETKEDKERIGASASPPDADSVASAETQVPPRPSLAVWRAAIDQLDMRIVSSIQSRENVIRNTGHGTSVVRAEIERLRRLRQNVRALADQVTEQTPAGALIELDRIGREECGLAWPVLHLPSVSGEGDS